MMESINICSVDAGDDDDDGDQVANIHTHASPHWVLGTRIDQ